MLQETSDALFRQLRQTHPPDQAYSPDAFSTELMPSGIANFLRNTLNHRVLFERASLQSAWFDFEDERLSGFWNALAETARIPASEWERSLENATGIVLSYLVRPTHTLAGFIFGKENDPLGQDVVRRRMAYFEAYPYFADILGTHLERKSVENLNKDRFLDLVTQIDRRMTEGYDTDQWIALLNPLYDFFRIICEEADPTVPTGLLAVFFQDKGESKKYRRLVHTEQVHGLRQLTQDGLAEQLNAPEEPNALTRMSPASVVLNANSEAEMLATAEPIPQKAPIEAESAEFRPAQEEEVLLTPSIETPVANILPLSGDQSPLVRFTPPPAPTIVDEALDDERLEDLKLEAPTEGEHTQDEIQEAISPQPLPLWKQFNSVPPSERAPIVQTEQTQLQQTITQLEPLVMGFLSPERRTWFLRTLFNNSQGFYLEILTALQQCKSWDEASEVIALQLFLKNDLDIYSEPAVVFTDTVEKRFLQANRSASFAS